MIGGYCSPFLKNRGGFSAPIVYDWPMFIFPKYRFFRNPGSVFEKNFQKSSRKFGIMELLLFPNKGFDSFIYISEPNSLHRFSDMPSWHHPTNPSYIQHILFWFIIVTKFYISKVWSVPIIIVCLIVWHTELFHDMVLKMWYHQYFATCYTIQRWNDFVSDYHNGDIGFVVVSMILKMNYVI